LDLPYLNRAQHRVPDRFSRDNSEGDRIQQSILDLVGRDKIEHVSIVDRVKRVNRSRHGAVDLFRDLVERTRFEFLVRDDHGQGRVAAGRG